MFYDQVTSDVPFLSTFVIVCDSALYKDDICSPNYTFASEHLLKE